MYYYTCFYRHRDNSGKIIGYTLRNEQTSEWMQVTPEQLKDAIGHGRVHVFNLKMTSDGRIIESSNQAANVKLQNQNHLLHVDIKDDKEDLGYSKNLVREDLLENRVKPDQAFTKNGFLRFFKDTFNKWNNPKKYNNRLDVDTAYRADFSYDSGNFDGDSYDE